MIDEADDEPDLRHVFDEDALAEDGRGEGRLTGTPAFEALFEALEHAAPLDFISSLIPGSGAPFG